MSFNDNDMPQFGGSAGSPIDYTLGLSAFFTKVYGWMAFALVLSGLAAWLTGHNEVIAKAIFTGYTPMILFGAELALVFAIGAGMSRWSASVVTTLFVIYSVVNGLTLGVIFIVYELGSIVSTFAVTALTFGAMSLYGYTTKKDLTGIGKMLFFALIGLVIASIVNLFLQNSMFELVVSAIGVVVFIGLTAYDTQKLKAIAYTAEDQESMTKLAVYGALDLYLDFINLFLYLLRFMGNRRN